MVKQEISDLQGMQEVVLNMFYQFGIKETKRLFKDSMVFLILEYHETKNGFTIIDKANPKNKVTFNYHSEEGKARHSSQA